MCGIAGVFEMTGGSVTPALLKQMAECVVHRGPDDSGYHVADAIGLAFRRLSIIDIAHGNQPFQDDAGRITVICNGEIFNYQELREDLVKRGYPFRSNSDIEVLIPLYQLYGLDFVKKLNGQFAIALHDANTKTLILARDHVGICPLFYTQRGGALIFGSEIKSLLAHPAVDRKVNLQGLDQIISFPGMVSPVTMFDGIFALRPGHMLIAKMTGGVQEREYWDLDYPVERPDKRTEADCIEELHAALQQAVRLRLNADVPVGFYLSGGLDSSLIGSLAHAVKPDPMRASFSVGFADQDHDERKFQHLFTQHIPTKHHEIAFDWHDVSDALRAAVRYAESPLKESYNTCSLALSAAVRKAGVRVILTGEGADELFAGYVGYRFDSLRSRKPFSDPDLEELEEMAVRQKLWGNRDFFYEQNYHGLRETKLHLYSKEVSSRFSSFDAIREGVVNKSRLRGRDLIQQRSYVDFKLRLSDHLLADHGDRVAYANSIEARYPFLDIGVIDVARRLPARLKLNELVEKYAVRQVARKYLPSEIIDREKFHFVAPGSPQLLAQDIGWINDLLSPETIRRQGYFDSDTIEYLKTRYRAPGFKLNLPFESDLLMIAITFGLFLEEFQMPDLS